MKKKEYEDNEDLDNLDNLDDLDKGLSNDYNEISSAQANLLKSLVDFDSRLRSIVSSWLGLIWDEEQKKFIKNPNATPVMNEKGVNWFIDLFRTYLDKTNTLTTITKKSYLEIKHDVITLTWDNLAFRKDEFGIKNTGDMAKIGMQVEHCVDLLLLSLRGAGLKGVIKENYNYSEGNEEVKKKNTLKGMAKKIFTSTEDF